MVSKFGIAKQMPFDKGHMLWFTLSWMTVQAPVGNGQSFRQAWPPKRVPSSLRSAPPKFALDQNQSQSGAQPKHAEVILYSLKELQEPSPKPSPKVSAGPGGLCVAGARRFELGLWRT